MNRIETKTRELAKQLTDSRNCMKMEELNDLETFKKRLKALEANKME